MPNIILSSAIRSNVLQLQSIGKDQGIIQNRLATGLRVASALDDPRNFFQAQGLNNRASDLSRLQDRMGLAIKTIEAADKGLTAMTKIAENMAALANEAREATTVAQRTALQGQFEGLREQMARIARDSNFNGINLLNNQSLVVNFNQTPDSTLTVSPRDYAAAITAANAFVPATAVATIPQATAWNTVDAAGDTAIANSLAAVNLAIGNFRTDAQVLGSNLTTIKIREDFTNQMINTLKGGADGLVLADQNEEAANLLALNTRQQLSQQALSLAAQSEQSILRLLS